MKSTASVLALGSFFGGIWIAIVPVEQLLAQSKPNPSQASNAQGGWNVQAAARYLDDRMDLWFQKAKKLRTGQEKTSCVSCHTGVPYALARPLLRSAAGESKPTAQELTLLDEAVRPVDTYGSHD